nr:reverse transcriptase domain-containing protein [Tanacetum cinerariifolium]
MEKFMSERIDIEGRIKKKFKEQDRHFLGLGCDNIVMDRTVRNVMSYLFGVKKMLKNHQKSERSFPLPLGSDDAIADAAIATSGIDDDDDDTTPMDSQPYEPRGSPCDTYVEAAIRAERERVQNEANHAERTNVVLVARESTFADFMKCSPITFHGNQGAIGPIRWIEKTEMVFTVSKCTEANKVVFATATF